MHKLLPAIAAVVLVAGCSMLLPESKPLLSGSWGGQEISATAAEAGLVVRTPCSEFTFAGPVELQGNTFEARGVNADGGLNYRGDSVRITGLVSGNLLVLGYSEQYHAEAPDTQPLLPDDTLFSGQPLSVPDGSVCGD
jgi:hypothetical protein